MRGIRPQAYRTTVLNPFGAIGAPFRRDGGLPLHSRHGTGNARKRAYRTGKGLWYDEDMQERIDCLKCKHYFVTWDPARPRGCRYFGFKGPRMPSEVVRASSGEECRMFEPKGK